MAFTLDFSGAELTEFAAHLNDVAENAEKKLSGAFDELIDDAYEFMWDETPVDTGDLRDSIVVIRHGPLSAEVVPGKRVSGNHGLAFLIEYGAGNRPPNPFITRTAARANQAAAKFDLSSVL